MNFFKKKDKDSEKIIEQNKWKITEKCLNLIFEAAKSSYPNEFGAFLRVDDNYHNIISEIILLPGTIQGDSHTIFKLHLMPIDYNIVGTVHSHPSKIYFPSNADIQLFQKYGKIHIISAYPYDIKNFKTYDRFGKIIDIEIVR